MVIKRRRRKRKEPKVVIDESYQDMLVAMLESVPKDHEIFIDAKNRKVKCVKYGVGMFHSVREYHGSGMWR